MAAMALRFGGLPSAWASEDPRMIATMLQLDEERRSHG